MDAREAQVDPDEDVSKVSVSMLGETSESSPKERRNNPGSHADLAGCGGKTEGDIQDVGCSKLLGNEGEGVIVCCLLYSEERVPL